MKRATLLLLLVLFSPCALAAGVVGTWKGKVVVDPSSLPKSPDPHRVREIQDSVKRIQAATVTLVLKADKSYAALAIGGPNKSGKDEGTWSQVGSVLTMKSKRGGTAEKLNLAPDGRTMTMPLPESNGLRGKLIFKRS